MPSALPCGVSQVGSCHSRPLFLSRGGLQTRQNKIESVAHPRAPAGSFSPVLALERGHLRPANLASFKARFSAVRLTRHSSPQSEEKRFLPNSVFIATSFGTFPVVSAWCIQARLQAALLPVCEHLARQHCDPEWGFRRNANGGINPRATPLSFHAAL